MAKALKSATAPRAQPEKPNPKTPSGDYTTSCEYWKMINAILAGVDALRSKSSGEAATVSGPAIPVANLSQLNSGRRNRSGSSSPYLPAFNNETVDDYEYRRANAPFTNIYGDISANLASKPFAKECALASDSATDLMKYAEDIDGQGNSLHVFAAETFKAGIDFAIDWIFVDYTRVAAGATLADERALGARPYWVRIPATRLLAVYSDFLNGQEIIVHARIYEPMVVKDGYDEKTVERVRVLNREPITDEKTKKVIGYEGATWEVFELKTTKDNQNKESTEWQTVDGGAITIGIIPLIPFKTGKRDGTSWKIRPPLKDLAYLQIEEFQQESNLKTIKELAAFPMLSGNGVSPDDGKGGQVEITVGPHTVLFAPTQIDGRAPGSWTFIEPAGTSLVFLKDDLEALRTEMRNLGMQPLATANLTVVTTANVSMKAHNAVQAWALTLKDALELAWHYTCLWLNRKNEFPVVNVHVDFAVELQEGPELTILQSARTAKEISQQTYWKELKRRGVLSDDFDPDEEEKALADEKDTLDAEQPIDPVTGQRLPPPGGF